MGIRTDLAMESRQIFEESRKDGPAVEIPGVEVETEQWDQDVKVTRIRIVTDEGSQALRKPQGNYITIEVQGAVNGSDHCKETAARALASELRGLFPEGKTEERKTLVIGLGNDDVTPDSLGPRTVELVRITRHMFLLFADQVEKGLSCVSSLRPGVMASTGMETAELIRKTVEIAEPDVILAVDALAAREASRISTTIQISDTGISPGTGTGNMRKQLTEETIGKKVIAIGVPTVIDSDTLIMDSLGNFLQDRERAEAYLMERGLSVIVTSSDIDQVVKDFSEIIANAINIALHPGIYS